MCSKVRDFHENFPSILGKQKFFSVSKTTEVRSKMCTNKQNKHCFREQAWLAVSAAKYRKPDCSPSSTWTWAHGHNTWHSGPQSAQECGLDSLCSHIVPYTYKMYQQQNYQNR
jgi:hypothetical protein